MKQATKTQARDAAWDKLRRALLPLGDVGARAMFGGLGVFLDGVMFAKVAGDGAIYFRINETTEEAYVARGSARFYSAAKQKGMPYCRVPSSVLTNKAELLSWARTAHTVAVAAKR